MEYLVYLFLAVVGFAAGFWYQKSKTLKKIQGAEQRAEKILADAKDRETKFLIKAQEKGIKIIDDAKTEAEERRKEVRELQNRLEQRENSFSQKLLDLQDKQSKLYEKVAKVEEAKEKIKQIQEEQLAKLEKIAGMDKEQAKTVLLKNMEDNYQEDLLIRLKKLENRGEEEIEERIRQISAEAMERLSSDYVSELTTTTVDLPGDEMKGRIIGREGRNIKVIEKLTGTEIIVDDTPNVITVSGFSPIRRHIAKKTLDRLILDGRIHPTKIEEAIEQSKKEIAIDIKKAGEEAMYELGITGLDPKLVQILGRLKYRTSYGQNALQHSVEVAHLSALLAEELGADVTIAKKAGLLHDIGKAVDHEIKGTHPEIGKDIAKKFNLPEEVIAPIATHHDDHPEGLISIIVKVADAISASRPGARNDSFEKYIQRLEELEKIATSFEGVEKVYAIQAGREIRVFVSPDKINDISSYNLARSIARKIEEELKYPGEIKINVIREMRAIEYAR